MALARTAQRCSEAGCRNRREGRHTLCAKHRKRKSRYERLCVALAARLKGLALRKTRVARFCWFMGAREFGRLRHMEVPIHECYSGPVLLPGQSRQRLERRLCNLDRQDDRTSDAAVELALKDRSTKAQLCTLTLARRVKPAFLQHLGKTLDNVGDWWPEKAKLVAERARAFCKAGLLVVGPPAACSIERSFFSPATAKRCGKRAWQKRFPDRMLGPVQAMHDQADDVLSCLASARTASYEELVGTLEGITGFGEFTAGDIANDLIELPFFLRSKASRVFSDLAEWL